MLWIALLMVALVGTGVIQAAPIDKVQLEKDEDYSESLANQLHELSWALRERNAEKLAVHFAEGMVGEGLPEEAGRAVLEVKWIYEKQVRSGQKGLDREDFVDSWKGYLEHFSHFSSIEDVRFKVKQSHFREEAGVAADADIYFFIVGRNRQEQREWVEAKAHIEAHLNEAEEWKIRQFAFKSFKSRVATVDLFSEVALPAGVYRAVPPFGTPGNQDFVAHGVALADVDRDGFLDALATGTAENYLYINQGDGTFANRAEEAGIQFSPTAAAPLFVDFDNDGDDDLFLSAVGHQMLFENRLVPDGELNFVDISSAAGVSYPAQGFSALSGDVNGDGLPDIYVASYNKYGTIMPNGWANATNGTPNPLFVNQGSGRFEEQAKQWGVDDGRWSYAAYFGDLNDDGRTDLYVANDFGENGFYLNEGGRFRNAAVERGMLDPGNGMGVSLGDYDNDGDLDIHVTNMSSTAGNRILKRIFADGTAQLDQTRVLSKVASGNTIFENLGGGKFQDVTAALGPFSAGWSFGGGFIDIDNDGWEDLHVPNGFVSGKSLKDT